MNVFLGLLMIPVVFVIMEGVAWFLHKYVMHGFLWVLHEDHHRPTKSKLQKNDLYGLFFAILSILLILLGTLNGFNALFYLGWGITSYGIGYLLFHDIMFHRRIKSIRWRPQTPYFQRIIRAHATHHQKSTAHSGVAFGFLYASKKYNQG